MTIPLRKELWPYTTPDYDLDLDEPVTSSASDAIEWIVPQRAVRPPAVPGFEDIDDIVEELEESGTEWADALAQARKSIAATEIASVRLNGLARLRLAKGYSQSRLGRLVGTSQSHIAKIEHGKANPELDTMQRIANALEVSVVDVVAVIAEARE